MSNEPKKKRERIGKRKNAKTKAKTAFSQNIREARELIAGSDSAEGLKMLNTLAASTKNPIRRAKILLTIAESETRLSRHTEALAAFQKASRFAAQGADSQLTLLAGTGMVRSLLRSLRIEEAKIAAGTLLADLSAAEKSFENLQNVTPGQLAKQGVITVSARPPRATVCLTKIANAFLQSGLTEEARAFLLKAIQLSPNGASRARQALAKIALASDQPELAERYAREALLMGRFQAKTVAAWQLYLDARARQNLVPILEQDVLASFRQHAKGRIAAASALSITRVLRAHGDPAWKTIATSELERQRDPVISTEIEKLLHADSKLFSTEEPRQIAARALKLSRNKDVSAQEAVAHSKEYVRFSLRADRNPNLDRVIRIAEGKFPPVVLLSIRHAAALGAIMAEGYDLARQWLLALTTEAAQRKQITAWGKATWALARMESLTERNAEAAFWYMEVAANPQTPPRFKIQAMLRGLKFLAKSGDTSTDIGKITLNIRSILKATEDFRILLDAARQLALAGPNFSNLKNEAADRATDLADSLIASAQSPQEQLNHLEYLSRKLYWDLALYHAVIGRWDKLPVSRKSEFQSIGGTIWYEYLSLVFLSLVALGESVRADSLASTVIDDNHATPEGYVILGATYAEWLIRSGRQKQALDFFEWIAKEAPTHRKAAIAHYWLALRGAAQRQRNVVIFNSAMARKCYGGNPSLLSEWRIDACALILSSSTLLFERNHGAREKYTYEFLTDCKKIIHSDMSILEGH